MKARIKKIAKDIMPDNVLDFLRNFRKMFCSLYGDYTIYKIKQGQWDEVYYYQLYQIRSREQYIHYLKYAQEKAVNRIKNKKRIKIAFQVALISCWFGDDVLDRFIDDDRFDISVVITWQINSDRDREMEMLERHFANIKVKVLYADGSVSPKDFDIIIYSSPYIRALDKWRYDEIPLTTLVCYIPYGFFISGKEEYLSSYLNLFIHNICWRHYSLSKYYTRIVEQYCRIGSMNMIYTGYPKLDPLLRNDNAERCHWKSTGRNPKVKKIIYAPHHSINEIPFYANFDKNKDFILGLAKKYSDTTSWVFKPHPLLGKSCVKNGIFKTMEEYNNYLRAWDELPNAQSAEGEYMDIFLSSDCMVFDSMSFMVEYLYVHKPMLFLTRNNQNRLNTFGNLVLSSLYTCDGADFQGIENFILNVVDSDFKKEKREKVFDYYLDYYKDTHATASENVYNNIVQGLFEA